MDAEPVLERGGSSHVKVVLWGNAMGTILRDFGGEQPPARVGGADTPLSPMDPMGSRARSLLPAALRALG